MNTHSIKKTTPLFLRLSMALTLFPLLAATAHADDLAWTADFRIGGCGGAYFLAEPGELWVEVEKQDLNKRGRQTHVRAILFGPDRSVVAEETLPWMGMEKDSGTGPVQRVRLSVAVPRRGVYGLNITASEDRYGEDMVWGLRTNCARYLIETARGHKDERHQEPLVLANGDNPGTVCFLPRAGEFALDLTGIPGETARILDATGRQLAAFPLDEEGKAAWTAAANLRRDALPWQLVLSRANAVVNIDGVTRWDEKDGGLQDLALWSPRPRNWFPLHHNRWLLTPYNQRVNVTPGEAASVTFDLHNNGRDRKTVQLSLSYSDDPPWQAALDETRFEIPPGEAVPVTFAFTAPDGDMPARAHIRATADDGFTTYSTVELVSGVASVGDALELPLVLTPYRHENEQFGYAPDYPRTNQVYFDGDNRPAITDKDSVFLLRDGNWNTVPAGRLATTKVAFDGENGLYTLGARDGGTALLYASPGGNTMTATPLPGTGRFDLEQFSGHNQPDGPPPLVRFTRTASDPDRIWRKINDVDLFLPQETENGEIHVGAPIRLSAMGIGFSVHSGTPSSVVSRDGKVHVVWGEATDPEQEVPGVPTYVATHDRAAGTTTEPALVGYGPPANNVHNTPSITMDSQGYLHVLIGTHGQTFLYTRSLQPNDAGGGWTEPERLGPGLHQTYVGFVCGPDDTLHVVFRLWKKDTVYFPASLYATLAYMRKEPGGGWSEPQLLIVPPFSEYSVYYHRLTIDRAGALFLSYEYWSTYWFYRNDRRETRRALLTSPDSGATWSLAGDDIFQHAPKATHEMPPVALAEITAGGWASLPD